MSRWRRKFLVWRENLRRDPTEKKRNRLQRQNDIRNRKISFAKDLSVGHNLGEYNLQPEDLLVIMRVLGGKLISWSVLEKMFKKYR